MSKPINVEVKLGGKIKSINQLIRVFCKMCKEEKIIDEVRKKSFHKSKGQKRREKKDAAIRRSKRNAQKNK